MQKNGSSPPVKCKFVWVLQPILIAISPLIHMFFLNTNEINKFNLFFAATIITTCITILFLFLSFLYRNFFKGAITTNLLVLFFYGSAPIIHLVLVPISKHFFNFTVAGIRVLRIRYTLPILIIIVLFLIHRYGTKIKSEFFLKVLILPLIVFFGISFTKNIFSRQSGLHAIQQYDKFNENFRNKVLKQLPQNSHPQDYPDIYFIILDCYTSQDYYVKICNYNNQPFLEKLKQRGFYIPEKTHSNYGGTLLSLSSILNMNYHPTKLKTVPYHHMWERNNVSFFLKKLGYTYLDLYRNSLPQVNENKLSKPSFWQTMLHELKLFCFDYYHMGRYFLEWWTPLYPFVSFYDESFRQRIKEKLKALNDSVTLQSPKFVYAHFLIPHPPHVFMHDGSQLYPDDSNPEFEKMRYGHVESTRYINKEIMKSIIILQGDHGIDYTYQESSWCKCQILNSYYLPKGGTKKLYPSITPVNSFRVIFNQYFGTNLPLLKDEAHT